MTLKQLLLQLGISITSNLISDFVFSRLDSNKKVSKDELVKELGSFLNIDEAEIKAEKIINFFAVNGNITIQNSFVYTPQSILYQAGQNNKFTLKDGVSSKTDKSRVDIGQGASIQGSGGAFMHQDENGNISFGFKK